MTWSPPEPPAWLTRLNAHADAAGGAEQLVSLDPHGPGARQGYSLDPGRDLCHVSGLQLDVEPRRQFDVRQRDRAESSHDGPYPG